VLQAFEFDSLASLQIKVGIL